MKLSETKAGDLVTADGGFTCIKPGLHIVLADASGRLYLPCDHGQHYLDGQVDFKDDNLLVGLSKFDDRTTAEMMHDRDTR